MPQLIAELGDVEPAAVEIDYRYEINGIDVTAEMERLKVELPKAPQYAKLMRRYP